MFLAIDAMPVSEVLLLSLVGFALVFTVLVALMLVIRAIAAAMRAFEKKPEPAGAPPLSSKDAKSDAPAAQGRQAPAPGSLGECDLHSVDDKTAAMLMAIVADETQTPLNELRFVSIQEIREDAKNDI